MPEASFASLNPTLLARKGGAKPAMRPHVGVVPGMAVAGNVAQNFTPNLDDLEDLGWNDMGHDHEAREGGVVHLTPAPVNEETAGEAAANDVEAQAELADPSVKPVVRKQQEAISEKLAKPLKQPELAAPPATSTPIEAEPVAAEPKKANRKRNSTARRDHRAAFTLRLDAERHLKLRLASTIRECSAQMLVTEALDALLASMENLDSLVAQVQQGPNQTKLITGMKEGIEA